MLCSKGVVSPELPFMILVLVGQGSATPRLFETIRTQEVILRRRVQKYLFSCSELWNVQHFPPALHRGTLVQSWGQALRVVRSSHLRGLTPCLILSGGFWIPRFSRTSLTSKAPSTPTYCVYAPCSQFSVISLDLPRLAAG